MDILHVPGPDTRVSAIMRKTTHSILLLLVVFEFLYALGVAQHAVEFTWFGLVLSCLFVYGILIAMEVTHRRYLHVPLPGLVWVAGGLLVFVDFIGDFFHFYGRFVYYDTFAHFSSGIFVGGTFWYLATRIARGQHWRIPGWIRAFFVLSVNTLFAVFYEAEEYLEDLLFHSHRLGDGYDTVNDLLMNLCGASLVLLTIFYAPRVGACFRFSLKKAKDYASFLRRDRIIQIHDKPQSVP